MLLLDIVRPFSSAAPLALFVCPKDRNNQMLRGSHSRQLLKVVSLMSKNTY